jgi:hypothetical protein
MVISRRNCVPAGPISHPAPVTVPSLGVAALGSGLSVTSTVWPAAMAPAGMNTMRPAALETTPPLESIS